MSEAALSKEELAKAALSHLDDAEIAHLDAEELDVLIKMLMDGSDDIVQAMMGEEYEQVPVDPETFFTDPYYLGRTGADIYPKLLDDLIEIFTGDYTEIILGGSIGWGKSTITEFGLLRLAYEVLCLRDPQRSFGLMGGSSIVITNISVTERQAKKAIFAGMLTKIRQSPFFKENFPYDKNVLSELRFPKSVTIQPGASTDSSILGLNVIGGALDEGNFMPVTESKTMIAKLKGGKAGVYDKAESLYTAMLRRMKSRFLNRGKLPGKLFSISSAQYPGDFIDRRIKAGLSDPSVFVRNYALWEVKREQYSPRVFQVEVGTDLQGSRILTGEEDPETVVGQVIEVPEDFLMDFEKDLDGSIRDVAGIATLTVDQYIKNFSKVIECIDDDRKHAYTSESTTLRDGHKLYRKAYLKPDEEGKPILRLNPEAIRVAHIDPSLRRDSTGLAVGHIEDMVKVLRRREDGSTTEEWAPKIVYDLLLEIKPPKGGEIDFASVRDVIYGLKKDGMDIQVVTMDTWQSAEPLQQFRKRGYMTDHLSVDRTNDPYDTLKQAFYEGRVNMYRYPPVLSELRRLEIDRQKNKIDHPDNGSKDISDAMAGVAYMLTQYSGRLVKPTVGVTVY